MNTQNKKHIAAVIAVLTIGVLNASAVQAEAVENGGLIYNDRAYTPAIQSYPNAVVDRNADGAKIIYVDKSAGPAIYSYPGLALPCKRPTLMLNTSARLMARLFTVIPTVTSNIT